MPHSHQIYDSDKHFVIDPITRNITNNSSKLTIMQYDHNSERFTFEIPRVIEGHDMSLSNVVRVHFINIGSIKTNTNPGVYEVDDVAVLLDDPDTITFSWLISGASTKYNGSLNFAIRFYCLSDESKIEYSWGTNIYSGINIANSLDNSEVIAEDYLDVLEQWKQSLQYHISDDVIHITSEERSEWNSKQDKLIAGDNITISADGKTISTKGGSTVELDTTLSEAGKAADAKAVGDALAGKQDIISDLEAIRAGAAKGATALQSVPNTYRTASEQDTIDSGKVDKVTGKGLSSNDYTDAAKAKVNALAPVATSGSYDDLTNKPTIPTAYDDTEVRERIGAIEAKESTWDAKSNFSGNYNDLADKPTIPAPVTEQTVSGWGFTKNTGTYSKPTGGIPKTDLANDVQASLSKAETALQEHQSLAAYRTSAAQDIIDNGKQDKLIAGENITIAADGKTISATGGGTVPKPLTYDYMPEGYPTKTVQATTLMEEQELAFEVGEFESFATLPNPFEIIEGQTYKVKWDGTDYECVGFVNQSVPILGNLAIRDNFDDTGEPFLILDGEVITENTSASHTISVERIEEVITPIAYNFMPEGYPTKSGQNRTLMEEQEVAFSTANGTVYFANLPSTLDIVEGQPYTVTWDGTEYACVGLAIQENVYVIGNLSIMGSGDDTGEPFACVSSNGNMIGTFDTSASHTISVKEVETIIPMSEEFIPKMNVSTFTNDAGYLTLATLPKYEGVVV